MMGLYFAATGFGNKLAGFIGSASQSEPIKIQLKADKSQVKSFLNPADSVLAKDKDFVLNSLVYPENGQFEAIDPKTGKSLLPLIEFENTKRIKEVTNILNENNVSQENPYHVDFEFSKVSEADAKAMGKEFHLGYRGSFIIQEIQTNTEFKTFIGITVFTGLFGLLVIFLIKPLKRLTHGVEEDEGEVEEIENS